MVYFRDHQIAAPLKHDWPAASESPRNQFPRSPDRGPIEALPACWLRSASAYFRDHQIAAPLKQRNSPMHGLAKFPHFRDHQIAAPLKRASEIRSGEFSPGFPRSPDRGPIEAAARLRQRCLPRPDFRDHQIAAPLKPAMGPPLAAG